MSSDIARGAPLDARRTRPDRSRIFRRGHRDDARRVAGIDPGFQDGVDIAGTERRGNGRSENAGKRVAAATAPVNNSVSRRLSRTVIRVSPRKPRAFPSASAPRCRAWSAPAGRLPRRPALPRAPCCIARARSGRSRAAPSSLHHQAIMRRAVAAVERGQRAFDQFRHDLDRGRKLARHRRQRRRETTTAGRSCGRARRPARSSLRWA